MMKLTNVGPIRHASIDLERGLVFIGPNNSGKTYLTYSLYGILKEVIAIKDKFNIIDQEMEVFLSERSLVIDRDAYLERFAKFVEDHFEKNLDNILAATFNLSKENFKRTKIDIDYTELVNYVFVQNEASIEKKDSMFLLGIDATLIRIRVNISKSKYKFEIVSMEKNIFMLNEEENFDATIIDLAKLSKNDVRELRITLNRNVSRVLLPEINVLYIPAERNGINVFKSEIMSQRTRQYSKIINNNILKREFNRKPYPVPISDYLDYLSDVQDRDAFHYKYFKGGISNLYEFLSVYITKGKYITKSDNEIYFRQLFSNSTRGPRFEKMEIPFHVSSSSAKTLYGLDDYFLNQAKKGDILLIDEPEMNLDPATQIKMGEFLILCIKNGIRVIVSTHSDYIMRKMTNEMLKASDSLTENDVNTYILNDGMLKEISQKNRIEEISLFDSPSDELRDEFMAIMDELVEDNDYE